MACKVISLPTGRFDGRTYLLVCEDTREAAAVDADINMGAMLAALEREGAALQYILLTHCHFDHISSSDRLREKTGAKTAMHRLDIPALADPAVNLSAFDGEPITGRTIDTALEEGSIFRLGEIEIKTLHTPGHTPGSCCFLAGDNLFTGDTLFRGSHGNTAFPGGDMGSLMASAARLLSLDETLNVYPGHGDPTTVARERAYYPDPHMIQFVTNQPEFFNDLTDVVRLFFGMEKVSPNGEGAGLRIGHAFSECGGRWLERCEVSGGGRPKAIEELSYPAVSAGGRLLAARMQKRYAKLCLYALLKEYRGFTPPWGSLTGIRPTKLARQLMDEGRSLPEAIGALQTVFDVSAPKAALVEEVLRAQEGIYAWGDEAHFDVYIGIPFCRTRCLYCSFGSSGMGRPETVRAYAAALTREMEAFGALMRGFGRRCRAIYVGGGTPVALDTPMLRGILETARGAFPGAREFTVEAGRPDCITKENMRMLADLGAGRVSVNPQTMNARTLEVIGRAHTPEDVLRAFETAKQAGIPRVNMDIIAGLPGEGPADMAATLEALSPLGMDNLTVHTLAIKHSSRLNERLGEYPLPDAAAVSETLGMAHAFAAGKGMRPYYMYRQKYMAGNLENVGYALPGAECFYNVDMMEETHDIVALGAGAVSKRMYWAQTRHERCPNPKNVAYYIDTIGDIIGEKTAFFS